MYTQVCLILQEFTAVTPELSASTQVDTVIAHGGDISNAYVVYSRIVAQAADEGAATGHSGDGNGRFGFTDCPRDPGG